MSNNQQANETAQASTGIRTRLHDTDPFGYVVEWMDWDSDFRSGELRCGDIIVGVNEFKYAKANKESDHPKAIGNYLEATFFAENNWDTRQPITLQVYRDGQLLQIKGLLRIPQTYLNAEQRPILGDTGPTRLSNDGFSSSWANWYEKFIRQVVLYLDDHRWERTAMDNRRLLSEHMEWKERLDFLCNKYPGRFSTSLRQDWEKVREILEGFSYTDITDASLEYRKIGAERVKVVKEKSNSARKHYLDSLGEQLIKPFPAIDAVHGDMTTVTGKKVALPPITFDNFFNDLGKTYAVIGNSSEGHYFIHLNSPEMDIFFRTLFHYKAQVSPDIPESFEFIAEILPIPTMLTYQGRAITGVMLKVMAGMAGEGHVFIDTTQPVQDGRTIFAGEEALIMFAASPQAETASPKETVEAMIQYIKLGDMKAWRSLFATWQIYYEWDGPPYMDFAYWMPEESYQSTWEKSRRLILNDIYDARVIFEYPVRIIANANPAIGLPKVEQVKLIVDHVGKIEDEYRSVSNLYVHRIWILQRLDDGPWKIKELQGL